MKAIEKKSEWTPEKTLELYNRLVKNMEMFGYNTVTNKHLDLLYKEYLIETGKTIDEVNNHIKDSNFTNSFDQTKNSIRYLETARKMVEDTEDINMINNKIESLKHN